MSELLPIENTGKADDYPLTKIAARAQDFGTTKEEQLEAELAALREEIERLQNIELLAKLAKEKIPLKNYSLSIGGFLVLSALFDTLSEEGE